MAHQHDGGELQRTESYQYPSGHVNHLTQNQTEALGRFREICKSKGYWTPATDTAPASHDDETLLRYLRARKFAPQEAFAQLKDTEDWRVENQIDKLYETIDIQEYEQTRRLYPQWLGRRDKRGIPVYLFEVAHLDSKAVTANQSSSESKHQTVKAKVPPKMLRLFALYENLCRFVLPLCSTIPARPNPETPISQSSNIVDISGVSLMQFWKLKNHMQDASLLATAHYPETLDRIFLIGAPSFFPTVWGWIKRWFDPITVSKIFILTNAQTLPTLSKFIDVENIPKKYGGKLDFKFGDLPNIDDEIASSLHWQVPVKPGERRAFPTGPIRWQYEQNGELRIVAVGSDKGVQRNTFIAGLQPDATIAQVTLSPGRVQDPPTTTSTQPSTTPAANGAAKPPATAAIDHAANQNEAARPQQQNTSQAGTFEVPYRDNMPTAGSHPEVREGTSETRYEQQAHTHAHGNLAEGTPAIQRDGQGEKQAVMDPKTVGQAPKEHPLPQPEEPQPSIIDQAKQTAEQAYTQATQASQNVLAAVGFGEKKEEPKPPAVEEKKVDPAVDNMAGKNVEEYLRAKTMSRPQA